MVLAHWKKQSVCRHVAQLRNITLNPRQPVFALSPKCCVLSREATIVNFLVFGMTRSGFEPMIYHTLGEHANHCGYKHLKCKEHNRYSRYITQKCGICSLSRCTRWQYILSVRYWRNSCDWISIYTLFTSATIACNRYIPRNVVN